LEYPNRPTAGTSKFFHLGQHYRLGANRGKLASFSQAKYGAQTGNNAQWYPDAGNGNLTANGQYVTGNDPNDANVPSTSSYQQQWLQHMVTTFGPASATAPEKAR
jgi:Glycoside hydrolase family 44